MAVIKNTLYSLWDQPAKEDVGSAVAVMKLQLGGGGRVTRAVLSRRSGNAALDDSVERAASDIRRIRGLTPGFIRRHPSVTISFSVD
jgi:TonB family protein